MIKHSSVVSLANIWSPPITEIYIELYGWGRCDITEMRFFKKILCPTSIYNIYNTRNLAIVI